MDNNAQFDHKKYRTRKIDLDMLDKQMDAVLDSGVGKIGAIIAMCKIIVFFAYLWARKKLVDEQMLMHKQDYQLQNTSQNIEDLKDELD